MQVQREGETVNTELVGRLKIGGRWFGPGSVVALDKADVDILEMRGLAKKPEADAEPLNVEKKVKVQPPVSTPAPTSAPVVEDTAPAETATPDTTKDTGNGKQAQSTGKRR